MLWRILAWLFPAPFDADRATAWDEADYRALMLAWQDAQRGRCGPPWAWSDPAFRAECVRACREDR